MMQKKCTKEDAVSPVVGVMLMLVVTIIIAAVVAAFATGLVGQSSVAPQAIISVSDIGTSAGNLDTVSFAHKGGDTLSLSNTEVQLQSFGKNMKYTKADGKFVNAGNTLSPGDEFTINASDSYFDSGSIVKYTIIDTNSGSAVASGEFIVP